MEHLEFTEKLNELGLSFRNSGDIEIDSGDIKTDIIIISESECNYKNETGYRSRNAFDKSIVEAIDIDQWKHSMHFDICSENYEKFQDIIQNKIIKRAEDTRFLLRMYFLIQRELSKNQLKQVI